jgi:hypothetical protein
MRKCEVIFARALRYESQISGLAIVALLEGIQEIIWAKTLNE